MFGVDSSSKSQWLAVNVRSELAGDPMGVHSDQAECGSERRTQTRRFRNLSRRKYHPAFRGFSVRLIIVKTRTAATQTRESEASVAGVVAKCGK